MKPTLYTIDGCIKCHRAKKYLKKKEVPFIEKNLILDTEAALELKELLGEIVTPVFVSGTNIMVGSEIYNSEVEKVNLNKHNRSKR